VKDLTVGLCVLELYIPHSHSLKEKRQVLRSIKAKIKNQFNVVVAEVGEHDRWQSATLGMTTLSNDKCFVNEVLDKAAGLIDNFPEVQIVHQHLEFI